jgi:hypothetical protein
MNIIRVENESVLETLKCSNEFTNDNIKVVNNIPPFTPREGYVGVLKYNDEMGIYWDYVEDIPVEDRDISALELQEMIEEVL